MRLIDEFLKNLKETVDILDDYSSDDGGRIIEIPTSISFVTDLLNASESGQEPISNGKDKKAMTYCKSYGAHIIVRREYMTLSFQLPSMDCYKVHIIGIRND